MIRTIELLSRTSNLVFACHLVVIVTLILAMAHFAAAALQRSSSAVRHRVWCCAFLGLLLAPAAIVFLPKWRVPILPVATSDRLPTGPSSVVDIPSMNIETTSKVLPASASQSSAEHTSLGYLTGTMTRRQANDIRVESPGSRIRATLMRWPVFAITLWGLGVLPALIPPVFGLWQATRIARRSAPIMDREWEAWFLEMKERAGVKAPD